MRMGTQQLIQTDKPWTNYFIPPSEVFTSPIMKDFVVKIVINLARVVFTVKILKIGTPEIITIIVLQMEQLDFTVQYCVQKMQTE